MVLARRARLSATERVLDLGCGTGASLVPASTASGWIVGLDGSLEMLQHVPWPVPLLAGDAEDIPLRAASFDVIIAGFLVMFLPRPHTALRDWNRVLRPGGRLVFSVPEAEIPACGAVKGRWGAELGQPRPPQRSDTWVEEILADAGFAQVEASADSHTFSFATGEDYVRWNLSHGGRALLDAVPGERRAQFEAELVAAAESAREGDSIPLPTTARFWTAVKPG